MQEQEPKPRAEVTERNLVIFLFLGATMLSYALAPWVWPIGSVAGIVAVKVLRLARNGSPGEAARLALAAGVVGGVFTLPPSSPHSFWVRDHWTHPQNAPLLSLYAVALLVWGVTLFYLYQKQRDLAARQTE